MKTIKELAALTGFSSATISRVLTKNKSVTQETRKAVEEALEKLGYKPARHGRKSGAKKTVLLITAETASLFHQKFFDRLDAKLGEAGLTVLLAVSRFDEGSEEHFVEYAQGQGYCGIVMSTAVDTPGLKELIEKSPCPIVLVNRRLRTTDADAVYMDNYRAGYIAAGNLLDSGHRRIVCAAGPRKSASSADRVAGFGDALRDAGVDAGDWAVWDGDFTLDSGRRLGRKYAEAGRGYSAVFCVNELVARGFTETVLDLGLAVPDDVSIVCVTPEPVTIRDSVRLNCVINDAGLFGDTAAQMLLDRMGGLDVAPRKITYPPRLFPQESVKRME